MKHLKFGILLLAVQLFISLGAFAQKQFKVLMVTTTRGWHHESVHAGVLAIQQLAARNFFDAVLWEDPNGFTDKFLQQFQAVIFLNTTGDIFDTAQQKVIEAYHFLVSVSPETHAATFADYTNIITTSTISDLNYKGGNLSITYVEGNCYEYFDVPRALYIKLVNADTPGRFARRHICGSFVYREVSKVAVA